MYKIVNQVPENVLKSDILHESYEYTESWCENRSPLWDYMEIPSIIRNLNLDNNEFNKNINNYYYLIGCDEVYKYIPHCYLKGENKDIILVDCKTNKYLILNLTYVKKDRHVYFGRKSDYFKNSSIFD